MIKHSESSVGTEFAAHWRVVVAASSGMAVSLAMFNVVQSLFVKEMQTSFGWSRGDISLALAALIPAALTAPLVGRAIDRYGVRRVVFLCTIGMSMAALGLACITSAIWTYYLAFTMLLLLGAGTTPISYTRVVSTWFRKGLGLAIGITLSGLSITAFVMPPFLTYIIATYGWRAGYAVLAILPIMIGLPTAYFWLHERQNAQNDTPIDEDGLTAMQALKSSRFWIMCIAISLVSVPAISLSTQLQPLLTDKGFNDNSAAFLLSIFGVAVLVGRLIVGRLIDRYWAPGIACITLLLTSGGAFMLIGAKQDFTLAALSLTMLGFAQAAEVNLLAFLIARYFGTRHFSAIYGNINIFFGLSIAAGAIMFGKLYDSDHNYDRGLAIAGGCLIASGLLFPLMGRYPRNIKLKPVI